MSSDISDKDERKVTAVLSSKPAGDSSGTIRLGWIVLGAGLAALIATTITFPLLAMFEWLEPGPFLLNWAWPSFVFGVSLSALLVNLNVKDRRFTHTVLSAILSIPLSFALTYAYFMIYIVISMVSSPVD
jgi:hypothetical protein